MGHDPCSGCRVRHLSCDELDTCNQCSTTGRECVRGYNVRFRNLVCPPNHPVRDGPGRYQFFFALDQTWLRYSRNVRFAKGENSDDSEVSDENQPIPSSTDPLEARNQLLSGNIILRRYIEFHKEHQAPYAPRVSSDLITANTTRPRTQDHSRALSNVATDSEQGPHLPNVTEKTYTPADEGAVYRHESPRKDLSSLQEAKLLQHFVAHLAPWFDIADPRRHFTTVAPCLAMTSPILSNALLALAALHLSHISPTSHDGATALYYHDRCIEMMVPRLSDKLSTQDEALSLTCIILALYEDMDVGADSQRHVFATSLFLTPVLLTYPLRRAAFWCHLRQEIYAACSQQRPVNLDLSHCPVDKDFGQAEDHVWVHRALWICGLVVQWAFGEELTVSLWRELNDKVADWEDRRPSSFSPIYQRSRDPTAGRWFPDICYATDDHVCGVQFLVLAKLLLITHDPTLPRIGSKVKTAVAKMQDDARDIVRDLCGMGLSNNYVPAGFLGMLAIRICGGLFDEYEERKELLDVLRVTDESSGWPRGVAERALKEEWGWTDNPDS